ncbi:MAG: DUF3137 domain-containing protein [Pseudomonadota bacterium]
MTRDFTDWAAFSARRPEFEKSEQIWRSVLEPALSEREGDRANHIRTTITRTIFVGLAVGAPILGLMALTMGWGIISPVALFAVFIAAGAGFAVNGFRWLRVFTMHIKTKDLILGAATEMYGFEYDSLKPDLSGITDLKTLQDSIGELVETSKSSMGASVSIGPMSQNHESAAFNRLIENGLLPEADKNQFEDKITGVRAGAQFELVECEITDTSGDDSTVKFKGILLDIAYARPFLGKTLLSHEKRGWFTKLGKGLDTVDLNVAELDAAFSIYSSDQVEARYLLTPERMQRLIDLQKVFDGRNLRALFVDGRMTLALEGENLFEGGSIFKPLPDPARFQTALREIAQVCDVIDGFLDHNWTAKPN